MNMATPRDIHPSIASSATSPRDGKPPPSPPMPSPVTPTQKPSYPPAAEKYARLESLLRQTLALAGEISETKTPLKPARPYARPYTAGDTPAHLPRDCIILRKTTSSAEMETPGSGSGAGTTGGFDVRRHSATAHPRCVVARRSFSSSSFSACCGRGGGGRRNNTREGAASGIRTGGGGGEDEQHDRNRLGGGGGGGGEPEGSWDSSGASAGSSPSSVQEPFSPETLAQSLDAVVEGAEKEKRRAAKRLRETTGSRPDSAPPTRTSVAAPPPPYSPSPGPERPSQGSRLFPSLQTSEAAEPRLAGTSRWYVRIVPLVQRAGQEITSSSACLEPPPPPGTPMFMKLEAVFPYPCFAAADGAASSVEDDAAVTTGWDSEGSYIIIGRRPPVVDLSPADDDDDETHFRSCADYRRDHVAPQDRHRQSLQDYIEEWEREAGLTEAETEGSGEGDEMDRMDWAGD